MKYILELSESKLNVFCLQGRRSHNFKTKFEDFKLKRYKNNNFVFVHPMLMKRTDRGAIMFGYWVDVTSGLVPNSPKRGHATSQARLWQGIQTRRFNQIQDFFRRLTLMNKYNCISEKKLGVRCTLKYCIQGSANLSPPP